MTRRIGIGAILISLLMSGCTGRGIIYTSTVKPYSEDFNATPVGSKSCTINLHKIKEPLTRRNLTATWSTSAVLEKARKAGISQIYYIDKKTLSILNGIYQRETLIIHGD